MTDVTKFPPTSFGARLKVAPRTGMRCYHRSSVLVDEDARTLLCEHCGHTIDPIEWMTWWARNRDNEALSEQMATRALSAVMRFNGAGGFVTFRPSGVEVRSASGVRRALARGDAYSFGQRLILAIDEVSGERRGLKALAEDGEVGT